jgi:hypothetical protein
VFPSAFESATTSRNVSESIEVLFVTPAPLWPVLRPVALYQFTSSPMQFHVSRATVPRFLKKHDMMDVSGARLGLFTGHSQFYEVSWD